MRTEKEKNYSEELNRHLINLIAQENKPAIELVDDFPKYASRQAISRFLAQHELFKMILDNKGSIVECGVFRGSGLMAWAKLSAIYEPTNYHREIIGFDTFSGFPDVDIKDMAENKNVDAKTGGIFADSYDELKKAIDLYDSNRFLSHISKIKLVKGDFLKTGPEFLEKNQHLVISLLYLDFDIYKPTKEALKMFLPRMAAGSILVFDEINNPKWPGETVALMEELDLKKHTIKNFYYEPDISYIVL
ncbi:MAG: TylF/MycF/NovP-related O-methyltransferase [Patescibacteria group bacterium]